MISVTLQHHVILNTPLILCSLNHHTMWHHLAKVNNYDFALTNAKGSSA